MYRVRMLNGGDSAVTSEARVRSAVKRTIDEAVQRRAALCLPSDHTDSYRVVNSEGDGLSGLVVDVLGSCVVASISAGWVEMRKDFVQEVLRERFPTHTVVWRPAAARLKQDGWTMDEPGDVDADAPAPAEPPATVVARERGLEFVVDVTKGQKTGFFCDQRENRAAVAGLAEGKRVLDLFCYSGGFALSAAKAGATDCLGIDSSNEAILLARLNAQRNGLDGVAKFEKTDVEAFLKRHKEEQLEPYDIVICDPPKLAPSVKDLPRATKKYTSINALAIAAVKKGGLLMTCTCSSAMTCSRGYLGVVEDAALRAGRKVTLLRTSGAAPDHVLNPAYAEGEYLTALLFHVT